MAQIEEWGCAETPVFLTGTGYVGAVWAAAARLLARRDARIGRDGGVVIPVVAECDPSEWCDMRDGPEPDESLVARALDGAGDGAVAEGQVGAGVGMETFGFAGGIGTASRVTPRGHVLGVLVLSNFGWPERLTVAGRTLGPELLAPAVEPSEGSCVCLVATDAPLSVHQLQRLARRPFLGLARLGSFGSNGSGEVSIAWSTQNRLPRRDTSAVLEHRTLRDEELNPLFAATMEATEEAVLNALCAARALRGFDGRTLPAFPARRAAALAGAGS
jgi:D-aminopeptidase